MPKLDKNRVIFVAIIALFLLTRFLGFGHIYHQDEYRWASIADPFFGDLSSPHPPLAEYLYKLTGRFVGFDYLRIVPLVFSILNLLLVYLIVKKLTGKPGAALMASFLFVVNIYNAIANLQVDIDGALLPLFVLLGYYAYIHLADDPRNKKSWVLFAVSLVGGFLTKLSFVLFLGTVVIHLILTKKTNNFSFKTLLYYFVPVVVLAAAFYFLYVIKFEIIIKYAESFNTFNFGSRKYFDFAFKIFKSLVWLSPLLFWPTITGLFDRETIKKYGFWYLYVLVNILFYGVAFDFTTRTVERYFMFLIIPAVIIAGSVLYDFLSKQRHSRLAVKTSIVFFVVFTAVILYIPQQVLPLDPKAAYVQRVKLLDFNFLIPFSGGSGPSGFYFSAQFILWAWLFCLIFWLMVLLKSRYSKWAAILFIVFGLGYNVLFLNEYLGKSIYGNVPAVSRKTINYVLENEEIQNIITYYDVGAYYLKKSDQYNSRFYTSPSRDYTPKIAVFSGYYMIVDFPPIDKNGRYWPLIGKCPVVKTFKDKNVQSYIFDCRNI